MTTLTRVSTSLATACCLVSVAGGALAADSGAAADATATAAAGTNPAPTRLEEVVVTAEKRSERAIDVPMSVTAIDAAALTTNGYDQLKDYFDEVPGLSVSARGSGRTTLVLRGITTSNTGNPTVGVTIDNAPFGEAASDAQMIPDIDPFDLDHVEVLRGPQGTLYGASSIGGLVKYVMAKPDTAGFTARTEVDGSSTQHGGNGYGVRGMVNIPVNDAFAVRLSAFKRQDAGYIFDPLQNRKNVNESQVDGGRLVALWRINDAVSIQSSALIQDSESGATSDVDVDFKYQPLYGVYQHQRMPGTDGFRGWIHFYDTTIKANLGWGNLEATSAYEQLRHVGPQDVTGTFGGLAAMIFQLPQPPGAGIINNTRFNQFSQELRLSSPDDGRAFQWLYGLFYVTNDSEIYQEIYEADPNTGARIGLPSLFAGPTPSTYREYAGFVNFDYQLTSRFDVQVGGRYSKNIQDFIATASGPLNGGVTTVQTGNSSGNSVTYQVSPRYKITDNVQVYARVASGYRPGGANGIIPGIVIPLSYKADTTVNYELGLKGEFLDHTLTLETAVYYIDWHDIQVQLTDQQNGASYTTNAGTAKSQGAEASINWTPLRGLNIVGSLSYTDAKLTQNLQSGIDVNGNPTYTGFSGDPLPYSSKESGSVSIQQTFSLTSDLSGFVGGTASYVGQRLGDFGNTPATPRFRLPGYLTADFRTGLEDKDWAFTLYVKNVGDKMGYVNAQARNATTGISAYGVSLIQPRTVGLTLTKNW
jgi:outer membrane receptor protein involved in Fe transport